MSRRTLSAEEKARVEVFENFRAVAAVHEEHLENNLRRFLTACGWTYTSSHRMGGAFWLWRKEIDGEVVLLSAEQAVEFEESNLPEVDEDGDWDE